MDYIKRSTEFLQSHRLLRHLLFWIVVVTMYIPIGLLDDNDTILGILILNMCIHIPQILVAYFFAYYVIPQFAVKKRYVYAACLFLMATYFFPAMARILTVHVGEALVRQRPFEQESFYEIFTDLWKLYFTYFPVVYTVPFQFLFVKYFLDYKRTKDKELLLSKEKTEAELKTLKAQLNPHFLFNTLNNIYSLSLDNSPKTPLAIGKLSEILDHVLYQCNDKVVPLSSEIKLLQNYIELEKLRYDKRLQVDLEAHIEKDILIPPLVLLSLVENAFKHGAGEDSGSPKIGINITSNSRIFKAEITNTISSDYRVNEERIGLSNIRRQLDLMYANQYQMETELTPFSSALPRVSPGLFKVILAINPSANEN